MIKLRVNLIHLRTINIWEIPTIYISQLYVSEPATTKER
jgi:hypothetical protein